MIDLSRENLSHDPIHGYIAFIASTPDGEVSERDLIDHPWVQRLRHIHQLQTAWWVFPTAEHTRFQHVLGAMHLGSRWVDRLYDSLKSSCEELGETVPSRGYVECLARIAGLLHDVGHGPFGHFFDQHFLSHHGLNHERLGARIVTQELGSLISGLRRNPNSQLSPDETLDPNEVAWVIQRPTDIERDNTERPKWLIFLRSLLSGIYTIDNLDFVMRDAYMSGYSQNAYDIDRLLHYSFFTTRGLTIHDRGIESLVRFVAVRAELFRSIYFHRTVRAIDLTLADLFAASREWLFADSPLDDLDAYLRFTESSLMVDVARWSDSAEPRQKQLGCEWRALLARQIPWKMVCQRNLVFSEKDSEHSSIFSNADWVEQGIRRELNGRWRDQPLRIDIARHIYRPHTTGPTNHQNYLYDSAHDQVRLLTDHQLFRHLPISHRICRVYAQSSDLAGDVAAALDRIMGTQSIDDVTNM